MRRVCLKIESVLITSQLESAVRTSQPCGIDQLIVFEEADEHTAQDPCDGDLGGVVFAPNFKGLRCALGCLCLAVLDAQLRVDVRIPTRSDLGCPVRDASAASASPTTAVWGRSMPCSCLFRGSRRVCGAVEIREPCIGNPGPLVGTDHRNLFAVKRR